MTFTNSRPAGRRCPWPKSRGIVAALLGLALAAGAAAQGIIIHNALDPKGPIFFDQPLEEGEAYVKGKSIAELVQQVPIAPPIEGLPEALWMNQTCANCHQWDREGLCAQGNFYLTPAGEENLGKMHPLGGSFKRALRVWARDGCR